MASQRIRPSLADLYDEPAFPELEPGQAPAARVVRQRPPTVASGSLPPPIPVVPPSPADQAARPPPPSKPKSRFAAQREKDAAAAAAAAAAEAQANNDAQRFELDFDAEGDDEPERGGGALPRGGGRPSLVKGVVERPIGARGASAPKPPTAPGPARPSPLDARPTGFPSSSRGLFPRKAVPPPPSTATSSASMHLDDDVDAEPTNQDADPTSVDGLLDAVSRENDDVLRGMSEAQILEEQRQIREELGLSEGVLKMLQARGRKRAPAARATPTPRARPAPAGAPAPPAPRQAVAGEDEGDEEEGSPEYIRRHFFPDEPHNPALDWMKPQPQAARAGDASTLPAAARLAFDVQGRLLEGAAAPAGPAAAPDHHVSSSTTFTVPSLLALTASSVPSQRSTSFAILHRILSRSSEYAPRVGEQEWQALRVQAAQRAGWALRDANVGVVGACIALVAALLAQDVAAPAVAPAVPRLEGAEETASVASTFLDTAPLPALASHLALGVVPRTSLDAVLSILTSLVHLSRSSSSSADILDSFFETPRLLEAVVSTFLAVPYPSAPSTSPPSPAALTFLALLARTSRSRASLLCTRSLVDPTLRFVALPPWEFPPSSSAARTLGDALLRGTIELWTTLARYGLATDLRGKAAPLLDGLVERVGELRRESSSSGAGADAAWVAPFLGLLSMWTTAAVDPHVTGHDVTWSQVEGFRDVALEAYELGFALGEASGEGRAVVSAAVELLGSWLKGSKVNRSWRGEEERKWVRQALGDDFAAGGRTRTLVDRALAEVAGGEEEERESWAKLAARAVRLSDAYADPIEPATPQLFVLDAATAGAVVQGVVGGSAGSAALALAALLLPRLGLAERVSATVNLLPRFGVEDAVTARDLVDWLLAVVAKPDNHTLPPVAALDAQLELPALAHAAILRPFLTYAIVTASGGRVVGPLFPTPRDIKLTACLAPFAPAGPVLSPKWPLVALTELLRSGTSPVFQQLPKGWDASELQLVRSSLALMRLVRAATGKGSSRAAHDAAALVYDLVKVFMLEKDSSGTARGSSGADAEVFRDPACQAAMSALLAELSVGAQATPQVLLSDERPASATIEGVSAVVSSAPFYQLYTDLAGLYDAISLSDHLFGLVLLPPLAMAYPIDYRRLIWTDYAHILPALRFSVDEAISDVGGAGALAAYLAPTESSEPMLAAYVDALVAGRVSSERTPFPHLVALHHVAAALLEPESSGCKSAVKLVKALVGRGASKTIDEIVRYRQAQVGEPLILPPACFKAGAEQRAAQVARFKELAGTELAGKVDELVR